MIVVFPMLTSSTVSSNIQPGICKMLEKYIITHNIDNLLKQIKTRADVERIGANLKLKESAIIEANGGKGGKGGSGGSTKISINLGGKGGGKPSTSVGDAPKMQQTLSLEPTWVKIDTPDGAAVLGVKVMPFPVKSDENLIELMMTDKQLTFFKRLVTMYSRQAIRASVRILRTLGKVVGYKGGELTGDPKRDVLFAMSENKNNVLTLLNYADIQDEDFLKNAGGIRKLFSLGWRSFVLADDVNKRAMFCLNQFKGMCSVIPYSFVYASIGREHKEVYDDLEDVRKSGGAIFKMKTNIRQTFGEAMAHTRINSYTFLDEQDLLVEDFNSLVNRMTGGPINTTMTALDNIGKTGDSKAFAKITSKIPKMDISKINSILSKIAPKFTKNRATAERVLKNSIKGLNNAKVNTAATLMAFGASQAGENSDTVLKNSLKNFVKTVRSKKLNEAVAADTIKDTISTVVGPSPPEKIKEALDYILWVIDAIVRSIGEMKIGAIITYKALIKLIGTGAKTKIVLGISFAVLVLVLVVYLTRNN